MVDEIVWLAGLAVFMVGATMVLNRMRRRVRVNDWEQTAIYVDGVFERLLPPGRHTVWGDRRRVTVHPISTARQFAMFGPVDVISSDRAPIRLGATVVYQLDDVALSLREPVWTALNLTVSTALMRLASNHSLEALITHGVEIDQELAGQVGAKVGAAAVESVTVTAVTLPPELRRLMTEVERARLEGQAALERARAEQAALRSLANAARLLKDNPELAQLRMLQAVGSAKNATLVIGDPPRTTGTT